MAAVAAVATACRAAIPSDAARQCSASAAAGSDAAKADDWCSLLLQAIVTLHAAVAAAELLLLLQVV